jgi:tricorn protease-like protein
VGYLVALQGVASNCATVGASTVSVAITAGATASVAFDVVCETPTPLAIVRDGDIWVIRHDGGGATRLTTDPGPEWDPVWSSTGRIAFTTRRHSNDAELYAMNEDGTNPVRITTSAGTDDSPSWSPDGQRIAFRSLRDVNSEIYIVNADGTGLTRLTTNLATDHQPAWSSTGKIAFVSDRDHAAGEIYVMNEDGSNVVRLTQNESAESAPAWSPDGSQLAFGRSTQCYYTYYSCTQDIMVMNADGSGERPLPTVFMDAVYYGEPSWAPNGRSIAFTRQYCPYYCDPPAVWIANLDGMALVAQNAADPAWKP